MTLSIGTLSILTTTGRIQSGGPILGPAGAVLTPTFAVSSETSLGWYASGASTMALSFGTLIAPISAASTFRVSTNARLTQDANYVFLYDHDGNARIFIASAAGDQGFAYFDAGNNAASAFVFRSETDVVRMQLYSRGTLDLQQTRLVSVRTTASLDSTTLMANEMAFSIIPGSSGASLAIRSAGTIYYFSSSNSTKG